MKPTRIIRALVLTVVLSAAAWASSQDAVAGDAEWIQPVDKVFTVPEDVTFLQGVSPPGGGGDRSVGDRSGPAKSQHT